jgi:hypothetical protein
MLLMMITRLGFVRLTLSAGFLGLRKREMASWVVRIGCVTLMSRLAYLSPWGASFDLSDPGGCQKLLPIMPLVGPLPYAGAFDFLQCGSYTPAPGQT